MQFPIFGDLDANVTVNVSSVYTSCSPFQCQHVTMDSIAGAFHKSRGGVHLEETTRDG